MPLHVCQFDVAARILDLDTETEVLDFNDHTLNLHVQDWLPPEETWRKRRTDPDNVDGAFPYTRKLTANALILSVHVHDDTTWDAAEANWEVARAAYGAAEFFWLETQVQGVTRRYLAESPDVTPEGITAQTIASRWLTYVLRFPVQPNPTVTIAGSP